MVLMDQPTFPGIIAARPIGMLEMIDGDRDEKILCVPDKDPLQQGKIPSRLSTAPIDEIAEFSNLQNLEKKVTEIRGWQDVDQVMR